MVSIVADKQGNILTPPLVSALGLLDQKEDAELIKAISDEVRDEAENQLKGGKGKAFDDRIRSVMRRIIRDAIGKKPVLAVQLHQLGK